MVYNNKTLKILHPLTKVGEQHYAQMLESAADEILWKAEHPIMALLKAIKATINAFKFSFNPLLVKSQDVVAFPVPL